MYKYKYLITKPYAGIKFLTFKGKSKMEKLKSNSISRWIHRFMALFLTGLLLSTGSVFAQTDTPADNPLAKKFPENGVRTPIPTFDVEALAPSGNLIQDPGFEASYGSSAYWSQSSWNFGTPLCILSVCGNGGGTAKPRSGAVWAWFGGAPVTEAATVWQMVTLPQQCHLTLQFYFWIGAAASGSGVDDYFEIVTAGATVFSANATQIASYPKYKLVTVDLSPYANGSSYGLNLNSYTTDQLVTFNVDDLSLTTDGNCTISGNVGVPGATLSYTDGTPKSVVSNINGDYSITVPTLWSGTVTPSKAGVIFAPVNRSYSNLITNQTGQNYTAQVNISGNAGTAGVTMTYVVDGNTNTTTTDGSGNYSILVPYGWSGTITPSKVKYSFSPVNKTYNSLTTSQTSQNYVAFPTISGNVGIAGVILSYTDGVPKTVTSAADGSYSIAVSNNWTGTVTPSHECYTFDPSNTSYVNLLEGQDNQDYIPTINVPIGCADIDVLIGGTTQGRFGITSQGSTRQNFVQTNNGPVQINSTNGVSLIAAERVIYTVAGKATSFSEMMALPNSQLDTTYWLPWYNNVDLDTQLRIGNVSGSTANVNVYIGDTLVTTFALTASGAGQSTRMSFAGVNGGPVQIVSDQPIVAAERVIYNIGGVGTSFSEMMALPNSQLSNTYWLPWYNNVDLDTQLRIGNVSGTDASVHVYIGGTEMPGSPFVLTGTGAGQSTRISFPGVNAGPVQIVSDQPIVAAERVIYKVGGVATSFSEMMALPAGQLNTTYWLPWYNNVDLDTQLRIGNVSGTDASVHVYIGGVEMIGSPFALTATGAGQSTRLSFAGVNNGPVQIVSDQPIVAAERVIYTVGGVATSFSEMMALPDSLLDTSYWTPWYNNVDLDTQLRFGAP
jgi:hypothetical protein